MSPTRFLTLAVFSMALVALPANAQTIAVLHTFAGGTDGQSPAMGLTMDAGGNFYGTTYGAPDGAIPANYGTIYEITKKGKYVVIHRFHGPDGANPQVGYLILDSTGNLYGTARIGGTLPGGAAGAGSGTVFKLDRNHRLTTLYTFTGFLDGAEPSGTLVRNAAGEIFGTTQGGGTKGYGTVFKIDASGKESVLHNFRIGIANGGTSPYNGLVSDSRGNLYGVDGPGGDYTDHGGNVFKISDGGVERTLYHFTGGADGGIPSGQLLVDAQRNLYGVTSLGGTFNAGVIFKIDSSGKETVFHNFAGGPNNDGSLPVGGLITDGAGNLYGATNGGGVKSNYGTVFQLDTLGQLTILYTFAFSLEGGPVVGLTRDANGNLYGATSLNVGGINHFGSIFELTP